MKKLANWLVVIATVALAVLPVFYGQFQSELARWHLAAAANAVVVGGSPETSVERAVAAYPATEQLRDYWLYRVKRALAEDPTMVPDELQGAVSTDSSFVDLCDYSAPKLWLLELFPEFVEALRVKREAGSVFSADELNQFAYARSIIAVDLDEALEDIDRALKLDPGNFAYRDTRAWVLFQMGRPLEALDDANFAIRALQRMGTVNTWLEWIASATGATPESEAMPGESSEDELRKSESVAGDAGESVAGESAAAAEGDSEVDDSDFLYESMWDTEDELPTLSRAMAGEWLWGNGALYYHRARILEALGRDEEAQRDWDWLKERNLPLDGSLY